MLPLNWQRVRLGDICEFCNGGAYETLIVENGDFKLISLNSIDIDGNLKNTMKRVNFYDNSLKQDDIVMVLSDVAHGDFLGLCAVIPSNDYVLNQRMGRLRIRNDCINILFLRLYINANQKYFKMQGQGSSQLNLSKKAIEDFEIPLPPLNEQSAIADILSTLDRYLCALDALILKKEGVKKALSFELLSQRKRLRGFNQAWQRVRLGDILSYEQPTKYLVATTQYLQKGFTPILTAGKTFILGYTNDKHGIYTNIPVIIFDDFTTDSKMINFPFKVKSSAIKILSLRDNNQADLKYIYEKLTLLKYQVTDHKRYWIDEFSNFEILLPPLNEQSAIANILSALDHEIISLKNKKRQFDNIKKALNHDLMSAKIRVLKK
ncbi:restriction endonuclease subunit S [Helicobacter pylori]